MRRFGGRNRYRPVRGSCDILRIPGHGSGRRYSSVECDGLRHPARPHLSRDVAVRESVALHRKWLGDRIFRSKCNPGRCAARLQVARYGAVRRPVPVEMQSCQARRAVTGVLCCRRTVASPPAGCLVEGLCRVGPEVRRHRRTGDHRLWGVCGDPAGVPGVKPSGKFAGMCQPSPWEIWGAG